MAERRRQSETRCGLRASLASATILAVAGLATCEIRSASRETRGADVEPAARVVDDGDSVGRDPADDAERLTRECGLVAESLRARLPVGSSVGVYAPFVVAGDMQEERLEEFYKSAIEPFAQFVRESYSFAPPTEPITIIACSTEVGFRHYADWLYADRPASRFGYYKPATRTLLVNLATGLGALAHELTHALLAFELPGAPAWLEEGLATHHESFFQNWGPASDPTVATHVSQPDPSDGRRTVVLRALRQERLPALAELVHARRLQGDREAVYYAQAGHFCTYLQERALLPDLIARLGSDTRPPESHLRAVFSNQTLAEIDADFRSWLRSKE